MANAMRVRFRRWGAMGVRAGWIALATLLAACSGGGGGDIGSGNVGLTAIPWCDQPVMNFLDDGTTPQKTIGDWATVKDQLGFTPYLPPGLPKGTCLALAGGAIHSAIYGGQFSITYVLPNVGPLAFSEAPKRPTDTAGVQCVTAPVPGSTSETTAICRGLMGGTSVTIASRQSTSSLQQLFQSLQPTEDWVPTSALGGSPTPSPSATASS
jgi:hypothetical protein